MSLDLSIYNILYLCATLISLVLGVVMISFGMKEDKTNILMGLAYLLLGHGIFLILLIDSGLMPHFPSLYRTGNLAGLLYVPLTYLYFHHTLFPSKPKFWQLVFFLPALIYFIDFLPIYMLSSAEKLNLILEEIEDPNLFVAYNQSRFFPSDFYTGFRNVINTVFWILSVSLLFRFKRNQRFNKAQGEMVRWIKGYLFFQILLFLPFYFTLFLEDPGVIFRVTHFAAALLCLFSSIYLLYFPKVLYGYPQHKKEVDKAESGAEKKDKITKVSKPKELLDEARAKEIEQTLDTLMTKEKVFLKKGYTSHDLARDVDIPYYVLTSYLNHSVGLTFPDYINQKRIAYCIVLLESGKATHLTFEGIGELCGFSNRNSFGVAFKKVTGKTPSKFVKERKIRAEEPKKDIF